MSKNLKERSLIALFQFFLMTARHERKIKARSQAA